MPGWQCLSERSIETPVNSHTSRPVRGAAPLLQPAPSQPPPPQQASMAAREPQNAWQSNSDAFLPQQAGALHRSRASAALEKAPVKGLPHCSGHKMRNLVEHLAQKPAANIRWLLSKHEGRRLKFWVVGNVKTQPEMLCSPR